MAYGPIARIIVRYLVGAAVTYGMLAPESGAALAADPDVVAIVGAIVGALTEIVYAAARRRGWAT